MKSPILILMMIFSLLSVTQVVAMDFHVGEQSGIHQNHTQDDNDNLQQNKSETHDCVHCCHFHSVSNLYSIDPSNGILRKEGLSEYIFVILSFRASLDNPPPIS